MSTTFDKFGIGKSILKALDEIGFHEATPVQELAIPVIKSGQDILGIAQTGTGKTAAYLIPILMKLVKAEGEDPRALILVPTRELAIQVGEDIEELTQYTNIRSAAVFGGIGWTKHAELVKPGVDIVVATPGRLWDLYTVGALRLKKIKTLVIDEADRMLDMGFMPQLNQLFEVIPPKRQNLLFSATFSDKVELISNEFLTFPARVEVAPSATTVDKVEQYFYRLPNFRSKLNLINFLLTDTETYKRVIIFCATKENAELVFKVLDRKTEGEVRVLHSNKAQNTRINAIQSFKEGNVRVLISTDVSARGIDVSMISHVINFDLPTNYEDYVHRIGRTARANHDGVAISFLKPDEEFHLANIEKLIRMEITELPVPEKVELVQSSRSEIQEIAREMDRQKKLEDTGFKGAFHEKKPRRKKIPFAFNAKSKELRPYRNTRKG
ncbi:MAG: DEAD/DEAH box helicase [Prolixibacteraceae bacterium]|jgi:ATP-dependent RNA helicase RhlE|nr:DEAD/DEAH box helicase [Prolixibacteraceae bacterium]